MPPRLELKQLSKSYPTPTTPLVVLDNLSLTFTPEHHGIALLGPSGSGKSTLLHLLATLDTPTSGHILFNDQNPFTLSPTQLAHFRSQHIGLVFQDHHLLDSLTALENVLLAPLAQGKVTRDHTFHACELLNQVGLADRLTHRPSELSGGQRQRVAIARALMNHPTLLLCDEPTGNLDATTAHEIADLLAQLATDSETIVIVATHSAPLAQRFGTQLNLQNGTLIPISPAAP